MKKKIFIKTFGCQMNEYDSNRIYDSVSKLGFVKTSNQSNADCYILNTCHIRDKAKEKVYHEIGRVKKLYKNKKKPIMIIAGCVAQAENEEMFKREPYIDIILGPQSYHKVNNLLTEHIVNQKQEETEFDTISKFGYFDQVKNNNNKISAFLTENFLGSKDPTPPAIITFGEMKILSLFVLIFQFFFSLEIS